MINIRQKDNYSFKRERMVDKKLQRNIDRKVDRKIQRKIDIEKFYNILQKALIIRCMINFVQKDEIIHLKEKMVDRQIDRKIDKKIDKKIQRKIDREKL